MAIRGNIYGQSYVAQRTARAKSITSGSTTVVPDATTTPDQQNAYSTLLNLFTQYGLGSLAPVILKLVQSGASSDTITIQLRQTPEYKRRFSANETRIKKGLPALSEGDYLSAESSYRQVMASAGLPVGFYDNTSDFTSFIENDVSPTELNNRVTTAKEAIYQAPKETLDYLKQWYNEGDLVAMALDPAKASPLIDKRIKAAEAAATAKQFGTNIDQQSAELIGSTGASISQIQQGLSNVAQEASNAVKLGQIHGEDLNVGDLVAETFQNDATAALKRTKLGNAEKAAFGGSTSVQAGSLASKKGGSF